MLTFPPLPGHPGQQQQQQQQQQATSNNNNNNNKNKQQQCRTIYVDLTVKCIKNALKRPLSSTTVRGVTQGKAKKRKDQKRKIRHVNITLFMGSAIFGEIGVAGTVFGDLKFYLWSISPTKRVSWRQPEHEIMLFARLWDANMHFLSQVAVLLGCFSQSYSASCSGLFMRSAVTLELLVCCHTGSSYHVDLSFSFFNFLTYFCGVFKLCKSQVSH